MTEPKPKIMVVDDEPIIGELLTRFLTKRNPARLRHSGGYEVTSFTSGKKALEYLRRCPVNFLLTDLHMPEMNGVELIKATKELKPNLLILVMTGTPGSELMKEAVKLGISDYLVKLFNLDSLEKIVASRLQLPMPNHISLLE
jgi:DNA-binding NtrC family response regulator